MGRRSGGKDSRIQRGWVYGAMRGQQVIFGCVLMLLDNHDEIRYEPTNKA